MRAIAFSLKSTFLIPLQLVILFLSVESFAWS